ncbi:YchJ family metal-binding protein [Sphaerimonospora mesophila]|uniref:YchJ family protein n=1 Tax=Sphaerimonospora mesophila TaxID=37483 RepID=UPI0006E32E70
MARGRSGCPCGLLARYEDCCGRFHKGEAAPTAESLMRSRYSAFAVGDAGYLLRTWHPATRPTSLELEPSLRWVRLDVLEAAGRTVHFAAHYVDAGRPGVLEEHSRFIQDGDGWLYVGPVS